MAARELRPVTVVAVLVVLSAALVARSWLQAQLLRTGLTATLAADLSYLLVPAILIVLLFPLWARQTMFLAYQFRIETLSRQLVLKAIAIGFLVRVLWWCQLIVGTSFGYYTATDPDAIVGPVFSFRCATAGIVALGFFVMALLVPVVEEIVHRAYVQTALLRRGTVTAILISAFVFTIFHRMGSWPFVFTTGLVFGIQYRATGALWSSLISHATINGLIQVDWRCLSGHWNPSPLDIPLLGPGLAALAILIISATALLFILWKMATEAPTVPR